MFIREDFHTLDLPTKANSGYSAGGHSDNLEALLINWAEVICIVFYKNKHIIFIDLFLIYQSSF